ncbi:hypothetical protein AKJ63_00740 [candidate division MSBL1 archaeon SCGC-AAA259D18]|uniref:ABC transmembrane type-1 domain-containing protein n=1 Tax=candidate division MSBL1 archaeon SCGC-AAA259D18 TaxID=1698262 RepID=A0A133UCB0_9EURY|nr:hypothetical protein AKJ63_00740 [candidate division MSBL1 archaeon SCGC-AAA259D18]
MPGRLELLAGNTRFQVTVGIVIFVTLVGLIGPHFTRDPTDRLGGRYDPPCWKFKLGTDNAGRDVWSQLVNGIQNSLMVGGIAGGIAIVIAFLMGGVGGYKGGLTDEGINTVCNIFLVLPVIPMLIVLSRLAGRRTLFMVALIISILMWAGAARAIRSQVLSLKERGFVDLARISGKGDVSILFLEILPNMLAYVVIQFFSIVGGAIVTEAGISMLGLGPTTVSTLGSMLHWTIMKQAIHGGVWWWFVPPGLIVLFFTGSLFMVGSTIDDALNPKLRGVL